VVVVIVTKEALVVDILDGISDSEKGKL